jgi:hypothetical protein
MKTILLLMGILSAIQLSHGDSGSTNSANSSSPKVDQTKEDWVVAGRTLHDVHVINVYPDHVEITFTNDEGVSGTGGPQLADLSPELQKRFNYDPVAAKAASDQRALAQAASDRARQQQMEAASIAARQEEAVKDAPRFYLKARVIQVVAGGILVEMGMDMVPLYPNFDTAYKPRMKRPDLGVFFVKGYSHQADVAEGDGLRAVAIRDGTYTYTGTDGAEHRVASYTVIPENSPP